MATRSKQKERTKQAIVDAFRRLTGTGVIPSVDQVAEEAGVSRATVYRYFGSVSEIGWSTATGGQRPAETADLVDNAGPNVRDRVIAAEAHGNNTVFAMANGVRRYQIAFLLRVLAGEASPDDRPTRRLHYIDHALDPIAGSLPPDTLHRLRHGLALAIGSEAVVALLDACSLPEDQARDVTSWVCAALIDQALRDADIDGLGKPLDKDRT